MSFAVAPTHLQLAFDAENSISFCRRLEKERNSLTKGKNQMAIDLERLLNQKEV